MAAPTFRGTDAENSGNGTSLTLSPDAASANAQIDDIILAFLYRETTAAFTGTPSGYSLLGTQDQDTGGFKFRADVYWKRATSAGEADAVWSWTGSTWRGGICLVYAGCITTETPLVTWGFDKETSQNAQPSHAGITIARSNSGLVFVSWNFTGTTGTAPTGFAEREEAAGGENYGADDLTTAPGATGAVAATLVNPEYPVSILIELATEAAGGAPAALPLPGLLELQAVTRAANW